MDKDQVLQIFRDCGAMLEGHFILSSGLRSPVFLQKAKVFQYAAQTEKALQRPGRADQGGSARRHQSCLPCHRRHHPRL